MASKGATGGTDPATARAMTTATETGRCLATTSRPLISRAMPPLPTRAHRLPWSRRRVLPPARAIRGRPIWDLDELEMPGSPHQPTTVDVEGRVGGDPPQDDHSMDR